MNLHISFRNLCQPLMTGPQILIVAIIIVLVIAFIVTMLFVNAQTSKLIDVNVKLAESQRTLLSQNKTQTDLLEKLEEQNVCQQRASAAEAQYPVPTSQATTGAIIGHRPYLRVRIRRHTTFGSLPQVASTTPPEPKATTTIPMIVGEACPSASSLMRIKNKHKTCKIDNND